MNEERLWPPGFPSNDVLRSWLPIAVFVVASIALGFGEDELRQWGRYDREALAAGELWRLVTGHLVHLSWGHVWLNLAALVVMGILFNGLMSASDWVLAGVISAVSIDLGLYLFEPQVEWYVGLSGSLHGLMIVGSFALYRSYPPLGLVLLVGVLAKVSWEQLVGPMPFSESTSGGPVLVEAHFYGVLGGLLTQLISLWRRRA